MNTPVVITHDNLPADIAKLVAALVPSDLPRLERAFRGLSALHAAFAQILGPQPDAPPAEDLRAELEHQKRLNAALCERVHAQSDLLSKRAEADGLAAEVRRLTSLTEYHGDAIASFAEELGNLTSPVAVPVEEQPVRLPPEPPSDPLARACLRCPAFLFDAQSLEVGLCFGCRSPAPARRVDEPPAEPVVAAAAAATPAEAVPAPVEPAEAAPVGPSSNGKPKVTGAKADANRLAVARALANGPLPLKEIVAATGLPTSTAHSATKWEVAGKPWFQKEADRYGAPYRLTDAGRKALADAGYVLVPAAEPVTPTPEPKVEAEPEGEEETDAVPITVQELSRRQALAIAKAIFDAPTPEISRAQIEAATGLSESVVKQRLMAGSNGLGLPATRYFAKRNDGWGLTHVGVALAQGK